MENFPLQDFKHQLYLLHAEQKKQDAKFQCENEVITYISNHQNELLREFKEQNAALPFNISHQFRMCNFGEHHFEITTDYHEHDFGVDYDYLYVSCLGNKCSIK